MIGAIPCSTSEGGNPTPESPLMCRAASEKSVRICCKCAKEVEEEVVIETEPFDDLIAVSESKHLRPMSSTSFAVVLEKDCKTMPSCGGPATTHTLATLAIPARLTTGLQCCERSAIPARPNFCKQSSTISHCA